MAKRPGLFLNAYQLADGQTYCPPGQPGMNHDTATARGRYMARATAGTVRLAYMIRVRYKEKGAKMAADNVHWLKS